MGFIAGAWAIGEGFSGNDDFEQREGREHRGRVFRVLYLRGEHFCGINGHGFNGMFFTYFKVALGGVLEQILYRRRLRLLPCGFRELS